MARRLPLICGWWALALVGAACTGPEDESDYEPPRVAESTYVETGDFPEISRRGTLRLLVPATAAQAAAPASPVQAQIRYAAGFARSLDLEPVLVPVRYIDELIPALRAGRGDVIVANLPMTRSYRDRIAFTVPLDRSQRKLVARADDPIEDFGDLAGRTLTVPFDSHFWETARELQLQYQGLRVDSRPALEEMRNLDAVASGEVELTLAESNLLEHALADRDDLRAVLPASEETGIAWGVRSESRELLAMMNRYITQQELARPERTIRTADLPGIREARTLRMATRNNAANYFVWRGQLLGFEYEMAQRFADELGLRLEVTVAASDEALLELVRDGEADIAAAFLGPIAQDDTGIAWSRHYHAARQQVVGRRAGERITGIEDLAGRTFHVPDDSRQALTLRLMAQVHDIDLEIETVAPEQESEATLQRVADGDYDLTLVDEHILHNAMIWIDGLQPHIAVGRDITHHWAMRANNPELRAAVDEFLARQYRSTFYNTLYAKYFHDRERVRGFSMQRIDLQHGREISPWDDMVQEYARQYGFDWRLVLAQIYQESSFNPEGRSWVGAEGLMQIMPRTARQLGVDGNLTDPETSIRAGIRYLDWLRDRFEEDLRIHDRMWFTLAAYNAGIGHVRDARQLADRLGHDRDRWFGNVEIAMEKLSQREYFQHARFGYVRGGEPVEYVRSIRERYQAYLLWTEDCWPVCTDSPHPETIEPQRTPATLLRVSN